MEFMAARRDRWRDLKCWELREGTGCRLRMERQWSRIICVELRNGEVGSVERGREIC